MTFNVRVFGYRGISQMAQHHVTLYTAESPWFLYQPYEWSQVLATNGPTPVSSVAIPNDGANILRIECPPGQTIRYEINPPQRGVAAGSASPSHAGNDQYFWPKGSTISIVEAVSFP